MKCIFHFSMKFTIKTKTYLQKALNIAVCLDFFGKCVIFWPKPKYFSILKSIAKRMYTLTCYKS